MAFGVLRALARVGLRVPTDVSVIGFDDHPMAPYFELTTISQDVRDQGRRIAEHLVDAVARAGAAPPVELHAPTRLVVRATTAVVARDKPGLPGTLGNRTVTDGWRFEPAVPARSAGPG
jgi:DNA-binding LacI/PurR family transcriptional regulator